MRIDFNFMSTGTDFILQKSQAGREHMRRLAIGTLLLRIMLVGTVLFALVACSDSAPQIPSPTPPGPEQPGPENPDPKQPNPGQPDPEEPDPKQPNPGPPDPELHTLVLGPNTGRVPVGSTLSFMAQLFDENGAPVIYDKFSFSSSPAGVLTIDSDGRASAEAVGTAFITVHADSMTAQATITVTPQSTAPAGISWESTIPPVLNAVNDITIAADGRYYTLINNRLFESVDSGSSWRPIYEAIADECGSTSWGTTLLSHPTLPHRLVLGCYYDAKLFASNDRGRTWSLFSSLPTRPDRDDKLVVYPNHAELWQWGANVSLDGGNTWRSLPTATSFVSPADPSTFLNPEAQTVSRDAGLTWQPIPPAPLDLPAGCSSVTRSLSGQIMHGTNLIAEVQRVYCNTPSVRHYFNLVFSTDLGNSWHLLPIGERPTAQYFNTSGVSRLAYGAADPDTIFYYQVNANQIQVAAISMDGSLTYYEFINPVNSSGSILTPLRPGALLVSGHSTFAFAIVQDFGASVARGAGGLGILRNSSMGLIRIPSIGMPELLDTAALEFRPVGALTGFTATGLSAGKADATTLDRLFVGSRFLSNSSEFRATNDGGLTWTTVLPSFALHQSPANPQLWYAAASNGAILTSSDNAASFQAIARIPSQPRIIAFAASYRSPLKAFALSDDGVRVTTDGGQTWPWASDGLGHTMGTDIVVDPTNDSIAYVGGHAGVWKTTDSGGSWQAHNVGLQNTEVSSLSISADGATLVAGTYDGGLYRSLDAGNTWEWAVDGLQNYRVNDVVIDPIDDNVMYAATQGGVYKSINKGSAWELASWGLHSPFVQWVELASDSQRLYLGTSDHGVYRGEVSSRTGAEFRTQALP